MNALPNCKLLCRFAIHWYQKASCFCRQKVALTLMAPMQRLYFYAQVSTDAYSFQVVCAAVILLIFRLRFLSQLRFGLL